MENNNRFFMGYFKWYWDQYGVFKAFKDFFGRQFIVKCVNTFFNSIGGGIGAFFFKRFFLAGTELGKYV